jgi:hypothetical protein
MRTTLGIDVLGHLRIDVLNIAILGYVTRDCPAPKQKIHMFEK